ncbi:MAG TPA: glycosyltransferase family 1 protein [Anaerovoracaceae bacterium]|nr:glycosyltransferase family 1 protein [Anaerovoracaceae bacterium]
MKIAIFTDTFYPQINGVTNTLGKMTQYFDENKIEYKVFAPRYDDGADLSAERFYSLKFFLYPDCRIALPNVFRIAQTLSDFKPDLIHLMTEFNMGLTGLHFGKKNHIPTVSNYSTNFSQYTDYYKLDFLKQGIWDYLRWFHNQNGITLCPSSESRKLLKQNDIGNTAIFSRGIDSVKFNPSLRSESLRKKLGIENKTAFLYVGRVSFEKDLDILSESYKRIKGKYGGRVAMIITGEGPYLDKCRAAFPADTIFTGFKRGTELSELYASSDIFVCPSSTETFGNVILEAMASGLPVIGADAGGLKEIITHKKNGLKFGIRDAEELTELMTELLENPGLRDRLKENGISFAAGRSWDRIIGSLVGIYSEVLAEKTLTEKVLAEKAAISA